MALVRATGQNTFEVIAGITLEDLADRVDRFGTFTDTAVTGVTFDVAPNAAVQKNYNTTSFYITWTQVGTAWTKRFYRATDTTTPFHTVQLTT